MKKKSLLLLGIGTTLAAAISAVALSGYNQFQSAKILKLRFGVAFWS